LTINIYVRLFPKAPRVPQKDAIPHEVVGLTVKKGYTLVRAWREYLRLTQAEVAERMGDRDFALIPGFAHGREACRVLYSFSSVYRDPSPPRP